MAGILKSNLEKIQHQIGNRSVLLLAVSKKQPIEKIEELFKLGVQNFGENYLQEALEKQKTLSHLKIRWHFIGQLQSKKIKDIVGNFDLVQTVWRTSELEKMNMVALEKNIKQDFLVQVNIAEEETKQGVHPTVLETFLLETAKYEQLNLKGLMFFPPLEATEKATRRWFEKSQKLFQKASGLHGNLQLMSMGTSQDYQLAIEYGSTLIRLGEVLLGERPRP